MPLLVFPPVAKCITSTSSWSNKTYFLPSLFYAHSPISISFIARMTIPTAPDSVEFKYPLSDKDLEVITCVIARLLHDTDNRAVHARVPGPWIVCVDTEVIRPA